MDAYLTHMLNRPPTHSGFDAQEKTPASRLLEKRKELLDIQLALDALKEEHGSRTTKAHDAEIELISKSANLLRYKEKVDEYAKACGRDQRTFEQRMDTAESKAESTMLTNSDLQTTLDVLEQVLVKKRTREQRLYRYRQFLEVLAKEEEEFGDDLDLVKRRFDVLLDTTSSLQGNIKEWSTASNQASVHLKKDIQAQLVREEILKAGLGECKVLLDQKREQGKHLEDTSHTLMQDSKEQIKCIGEIRMACDNMVRLIELEKEELFRKRRQQPPPRGRGQAVAILSQLKEIDRFIRDLVAIAKDAGMRLDDTNANMVDDLDDDDVWTTRLPPLTS